ncbi:response regulator [Deferrisoma sp.]
MDERKILVVDDDAELCELLQEYLGREGFGVETAPDGPAGLDRARAGAFDLVVLDVMLPGLDGFEVLRELRKTSDVPVIMLTARGDDVDRIVGLELGADDYLPKPFNPRELLARIRAVGRRARAGREPEVVRAGDLELDPGTRTALRAGEPVDLTSAEFSLLEVLLRQAGRPVSRDELARQGLGRPLMAFDRSVDVHVSSLRRKLGPAPDGTERIRTVRGVGYLYALPGRRGP